jgi:hypothetical protein
LLTIAIFSYEREGSAGIAPLPHILMPSLRHVELDRKRTDTVGESFEANAAENWPGNGRQLSLNPYGLAEGAGLRSDTDVDASKRF